jgi:putative nucleotidyltransferase with HDIG domain
LADRKEYDVATMITKSLREVHPRELKKLVKEIPTLPTIYQQLFQMLQDPNVEVSEIAEVISKDQSLAAKVLHLVNSAFYAKNEKINTISRAVVILGFQAVRTATLATGVFDYFEGENEKEEESLAQYWKHSIAVASICQVIARETGKAQPEEAFVIGLLHDTGKLVMKNYFPQDFQEVIETLKNNPTSWYEAERSLFRVDHAIIGKAIFRSWKFPENVIEAIQLHHNPSPKCSNPELVALVHLADYLAYQVGQGAPLSPGPSECSAVSYKALGITPEETLDLQETFREEITQAAGMLELST